MFKKVQLSEFEIKSIQIKAKGGQVRFEWKEFQPYETAIITEEHSRQTENVINVDIFDLIERLKPFIPLPNESQGRKDEVMEDLVIEKVLFFNDCLDEKDYQLDIHYKAPIFSDKMSKSSTGRQTIFAISRLTDSDSNELLGLITEIEANAYRFCIQKEIFEYPTEPMSLDVDGNFDFE